MAKTYDPACYELAEHFLQDSAVKDHPALLKNQCHSLALEIQQAVEDWFTDEGDIPTIGDSTPLPQDRKED